MNTLVRRGLLVLGFSALVGVAMVPLGESGWAEGIRAEQAKQRSEARDGANPQPHVAVRLLAPLVKETLLMGIPAMSVVLLSMVARRR